MKTPAAILVEQHKHLVIDQVELPALSYGQVLVEIDTTRICGSQLGEIDGVKGPDRFLPHLLGHEGGGTVLEIGPEVKQIRVGDRVVLHWRVGAGIEARPPTYKWGARTVNAGYLTTFQRYAVVSENRLTAVPDTVSFESAALLADTLTTGFGVINNDAKVKIGEGVVIVGVGGIGLGVVLGARLAGACPIIGVDLYEHKLEMAQEFGATHVLKGDDPRWTSEASKILGGKAPVVIDGTGRPEVIDQCLSLTASDGRCVIFGVMHHAHKLSLNTLQLHFGKVLCGSWGGDSKPHLDIPRYVRMMKEGLFSADRFISHRCRLEQINETIQMMRSGEVIHAVIKFE